MRKNSKRSILALLAKNYLLLTLFVVVVAVTLLHVYDVRIRQLSKTPQMKDVVQYIEEHGITSEKIVTPQGYQIRQTIVKSDNGKEEKVLIVESHPSAKNVGEAYRILKYGVFAALLCYMALVIIFAWWTYRNVDKPLKLLDKAINAFEAGTVPQLAHPQHREFAELFDSFSNMAYRLTKSEETRKKLEEERSQLIANISHDLKTPVTVIAGYSKAICDDLIPDSEKRMYFESIYQKSSHLSDLITAFAEYSKLEHPDFKIHTKRVDVCEFIRVYLAGMYGEIEIEGFGLEAEIPEESIYCNIDEFHFARVLENIIGNAIRYNKAGTSIYVGISKNEPEKKVTLMIGDNGSGIPVEIQRHIFEPFVVGDDARGNNQGSGLGLAVVKKILEDHKGTIELRRKPMGEWKTLFVINLPLEEKLS